MITSNTFLLTIPFFLRYNIMFLLSAGGKFNYQGSRKWLEEGLDNSGGSINESPSALLTNTKLVVCLDSLASRNSNSLRMHVSKPPSPGTVAASLHSNIMKVFLNRVYLGSYYL